MLLESREQRRGYGRIWDTESSCQQLRMRQSMPAVERQDACHRFQIRDGLRDDVNTAWINGCGLTMAWIQETESANSHTRIQAHNAVARRFPKKEVTDPHSPVGVSHKPLQTSCQWKRYRAA